METLNPLSIALIFIGGPVYLYFIVRWVTSAIVRSYYETKTQLKKEEEAKKR